MNYSVRPKSHKPLFLAMATIVVVLVVGFGAWFWLARSPGNTASPQPQQRTKTLKSSAVSVTGRYLFHGTTTWSRGVEQKSQRPDGSYDYEQPFSGLNTFSPEKYDAWLTSFECPITNNVVPFRTQVDKLIFNCRPEFLKSATKYFDIFDLANNHTGDQGGEEGLVSTRKYLSEAGVQYFGSFDPSDTNNICELVSLPVRVQKSNKTEEQAKLPVALCGWHYFMRKPLPGEIETMQRYAAIMPVIGFVEMGLEYQPSASSSQQEIAHAVIDAGADFVVANNPHWVQNTESYKGKLIVYATGNFIFDQLEAEEKRSASLDVTMNIPYTKTVQQWLTLGAQCATYHTQCLEGAEQQKLAELKPSYQFAVVAGQGGYGVVTHRADAATQAAVEQRMNWVETLRQLQDR